MKRSRELEEAVVEIIEEGRKKDEQDEYVYPVIYEPSVFAFFHAKEALFDALMNRPIMVLNLIQTNKALQSLWNKFPRIWIILTDALIEKAMGSYAAVVYPFMAVAWEKENPGVEGKVMFIDGKNGGKYNQFFLKNVILSYDKNDNTEAPLPLTFYIIPRTDTLRRYFLKLHSGRYLSRITDSVVRYASFSTGPGLLIVKGDDRILNLTMETLKNDLMWPMRLIDAMSWKEKDELVEMIALVDIEIPQRRLFGEPPLTKLDETSVAEYRTELYEKIYATPSAQKKFFIRVLQALSDTQSKASMIDQYGHLLPLNCVVCTQETTLVDPLLMRVFCSDLCREKY